MRYGIDINMMRGPKEQRFGFGIVSIMYVYNPEAAGTTASSSRPTKQITNPTQQIYVGTTAYLHKTSARMSFEAYLEAAKECPLHDPSASNHSSSLGVPASPSTTTHQ